MVSRVAFVILPNDRTARLLTEQEKRFWQGQWRRRLDCAQADRNIERYGLVHYESPEVPYTGIYLLGFFRDAGWGIAALDLWDNGQLDCRGDLAQQNIKQVTADVYLFSPFSTNYHIAVRYLRLIKMAHPQALCVVGGHHVSARIEDALADGFDYVVSGQGEDAVQWMAETRFAPCAEVPSGVFWRNGRRQGRPAVTIRPDLDQIPMPAFEVLPGRFRKNYYTRLFTSYGCPFRCAFCSSRIWTGMQPWYKSPKRVSQELALIRRNIAFEEIYIGDETFTVDCMHALSIADLLHAAGVSWGAETRLDLADEATLAQLAQLGCREMDFGLESLDPGILALARKRIDPTLAGEIFRRTREAGLRTHANLMVGLPGETAETARATITQVCSWITKGWITTVDYFITVPYPGTTLFEQRDRFGITIRHEDWPRYREDNMPVYDLATISAEKIYELWLEGMERIVQAYGA